MNNWLWAIGLIFQGLLLVGLVRYGFARRMPFWTALIGFYVARSIFLFTFFGHLSKPVYSLSYQGLSLVDMVLQVLVAWELFSGGRQEARVPLGTTSKPNAVLIRLAAFCALVVGSAAAAWAMSAAIPSNPNSPIDRGVMLTSILLLAVAVLNLCGYGRTRSSVPRLVPAGFAVLATAGILTQIGRSLAAFHREAGSYRDWTYTSAFAYFVVLLFWLAALFVSSTRFPSPGNALNR